MNRLTQHYHDVAQRRLTNFIRSRYPLITVIPTQGVFNYRCYLNAIQYALDHEGLEVTEVIYLNDGTPILHYVNYNPKTDTYHETTTGFLAAYYEYYRLRTIHPDDYKYMQAEFDRAVDSWTQQFTTKFQRWLGVERIL